MASAPLMEAEIAPVMQAKIENARLYEISIAPLMQAKIEKAHLYEISVDVKDPQVVIINLEPSTTERFIACLA